MLIHQQLVGEYGEFSMNCDFLYTPISAKCNDSETLFSSDAALPLTATCVTEFLRLHTGDPPARLERCGRVSVL